MQSHLTEGNTEKEEAETRFPLHPEGERGLYGLGSLWGGGQGGQGQGWDRRGPGQAGEQEREEGERTAGARRHRGCLFSALPGDVTAMLTWPTPCPSPARHPAQPRPPGPPSRSQGRRCGVGCVSRHNTDPHRLAQALAISLCPTLGPWGGVGTGDQYAWLGDRERRKPWTETVSKEQGPVLQQPLGTSNIPPEGQGDRRQEEQESDPGGHLESDRVGGGG